jgi:hypothetical protein
MPRVISAATGVLLILATLYFATLVVGAPPVASTQPAAPQPTFDRPHRRGHWTTVYPVAGKDRSLTYTFKGDGTFEEYESNWGRNWGDWRLEGDTLHMHWRGRRGFNGTMHVLKLTNVEWASEYPAKTIRTYTRPPARPAAEPSPGQRPLDRLRSRP